MNEQLDPDQPRDGGRADGSDGLEAVGFEPAIGATASASTSGSSARRAAPRRRLPARLAAGAALVGALGVMGGVYSAFAASSGAASSTTAQAAEGKQLFDVTCVTCHGVNLQGVDGRGPSLIGVGAAAAYFQVITGRMPLANQGVEASRKAPRYDEAQTRALAAYIEEVGGGPQLPTGSLRVASNTDIADGGELFRLNCAQCHGATGHGAPLTAGKYAPTLLTASDMVIYTAMLSGPENMPVFGDNEISPDEKKRIISYIQNLKASDDPGGNGIGRIGPVSEGMVLWLGGIGALMVTILWIGAKSQ